MTAASTRVLHIFEEFEREEMDLHALFEAEGNDPDRNQTVLAAVDELTREGLLESRGNDFYALTAKGKAALTASPTR